MIITVTVAVTVIVVVVVVVVRGIVVSDLIFFFFLFSPSEEGFDQIGWARSLPVVIFGGGRGGGMGCRRDDDCVSLHSGKQKRRWGLGVQKGKRRAWDGMGWGVMIWDFEPVDTVSNFFLKGFSGLVFISSFSFPPLLLPCGFILCVVGVTRLIGCLCAWAAAASSSSPSSSSFPSPPLLASTGPTPAPTLRSRSRSRSQGSPARSRRHTARPRRPRSSSSRSSPRPSRSSATSPAAPSAAPVGRTGRCTGRGAR